MLRTEPGSDRGKLGFKEAVLSNFDFLKSFGLKPKQAGPTFVRYESKTTFVDVYHGRSSFEMGIDVGRRDRPEKYSLGYLVSRAGKSAWDTEGFSRGTIFQVSSYEAVQRTAKEIAQLLKKYGSSSCVGIQLSMMNLKRQTGVHPRHTPVVKGWQSCGRKRRQHGLPKTMHGSWSYISRCILTLMR